MIIGNFRAIFLGLAGLSKNAMVPFAVSFVQHTKIVVIGTTSFCGDMKFIVFLPFFGCLGIFEAISIDF